MPVARRQAVPVQPFVPAPTLPFNRKERVGVVLGAGATKACDGPLTNEILPKAFAAARGKRLDQLDKFLQYLFGVPGDRAVRKDGDYPPLPTVLSMLDTAISREHDFGPEWPTPLLRQVRRQAEYAVFHAIAHSMGRHESWQNRCHEDLLDHIFQRTGQWPSVVSLNYDLRIDYAMIDADGGGLPDYGCDIRTTGYAKAAKFGRLFKIHGSMHWLYCPTCHRLELGMKEDGRFSRTGLTMAASLAEGFSERAIYCSDCRTGFRTVMVTPTSLKDYRNPHIASLWYQAERALRECDRVVFIGYSLPWDDVDVLYLLKRGLSKLSGKQITVVEWAEEPMPLDRHDAGQRYQAVFGRDIDWQPIGFVEWVRTLG